MNPDFTGWQLRLEGPKAIKDLRLVNCEITERKVTKALGVKRLVELKLKQSKTRYSGDIGYNDTEIELENAHIYPFLEHEASIILNPLDDDRYQILLLFADEGKAEQISEIFETFLEVIDFANLYYANKKAEKGAKTLKLVSASHLN